VNVGMVADEGGRVGVGVGKLLENEVDFDLDLEDRKRLKAEQNLRPFAMNTETPFLVSKCLGSCLLKSVKDLIQRQEREMTKEKTMANEAPQSSEQMMEGW